MRRLMLISAAVAALCLAQGPGGFGPVPGGPPAAPSFDQIKAYLSLTDTQLQTIQQIIRQNGDTMRPVRDEMAQRQANLHDLLQKGTTDAAAVGRLMLDIEALRKRLDELRSTAQTQARAALTDAQRARLKTLEDAVALGGEIREATLLFLLSPPAPSAGPGMGPGRAINPMGVPRMRR